MVGIPLLVPGDQLGIQFPHREAIAYARPQVMRCRTGLRRFLSFCGYRRFGKKLDLDVACRGKKFWHTRFRHGRVECERFFRVPGHKYFGCVSKGWQAECANREQSGKNQSNQ